MYIDYYIICKVFGYHLKPNSNLQTQTVFFEQLFSACIETLPNGIDSADISRITRGLDKMNTNIKAYYAKDDSVEQLAMDIEERFFPELRSYEAVIRMFRRLIAWDEEMRLDLQAKDRLDYTGHLRREAAMYLAYIVQYAVCRAHIPRDKETGELIYPAWMTPKLNQYLLSQKVPAFCKYFMDREAGMESLANQKDWRCCEVWSNLSCNRSMSCL